MSSVAENEIKKREAVNRTFDLCENIIKKWIAGYLAADPKDVFDVYGDEVVPVFFSHEDKQYQIKPHLYPHDASVDSSKFPRTHQVAVTVNSIMENLPNIFASIVHTMHDPMKMLGVIPRMDPETFTYKLAYMHPTLLRYHKAKFLFERLVTSASPDELENTKEFTRLRCEMHELMTTITAEGLVDASNAKCREIEAVHQRYSVSITEVIKDEVTDFVKLKKIIEAVGGGEYQDPDEIDSEAKELMSASDGK
jgi:hypothetical protein